MNRLRVTSNDRKRYVFWAALSAVFILLAGGANALATTNTVRCVPSHTLNSGCTATDYTTIQSAVTAASPGDVILVGPGTHNESVYIGTSNLSIFGAQAGKDARLDRHDPSKESIVNAAGQSGGFGGGAAFNIEASNVVIDGFTIQGGTAGYYASGIYVYGNTPQILNNIIQDNAVGVYLNYFDYALIEYNLFKTNNMGAAGYYDTAIPGPGFGIASDLFYPMSITQNAFTGNWGAAMWLDDVDGVAITKNTSEKDGSFVVFYDCDNTYFTQNQGRDFGAQGFKPVYGTTDADAAIDVLYYNLGLQINDNVLDEGKTAGYNGIAFSTIAGFDSGDVCEYCHVSNNTITRFTGNGIVAEPGDSSSPWYPTLVYSMISSNDVEDNGNDGILIESGQYNGYNSLFDNKAEGNHANDCEDDTALTGSFTAETLNTWFNNIGPMSEPAGLCAPAPPRWHWPY